jgi:16S rRNA (cytidine1402-2'-O)-methyltransferase
MLSVFGNRNIALCRELTKLNEEIDRTTIENAISDYETKEPRGEYVLIIDGAKSEQKADWESLTIEEHVNFYISNGLDKMDAIKKTAKDRGVPKGEIYKQIIK